MKKILGYFKPYKWQALLGPLFKLLEATFELLVPFVVAAIVDTGFGAQINGKYPDANTSFIIGMCALLAGFGLVGFIFAVLAQYFSARAATGVCASVRKDLFKKLQSLSYKDFDNMGEATILTRMTGDVDKMQTGINLFLRLFLRSPFIV
ncbi:MAG: ABC transporter ATP-binding protein, partial [Clostridia bacterium]|nr:ABC transporter ATP-binding protein [Clostridia bacterium]